MTLEQKRAKSKRFYDKNKSDPEFMIKQRQRCNRNRKLNPERTKELRRKHQAIYRERADDCYIKALIRDSTNLNVHQMHLSPEDLDRYRTIILTKRNSDGKRNQ